MQGRPPVTHEERWQSHRLAATLLRLAIFLTPVALGFLAGSGAGRLLPPPETAWGVVVWWLTVVVVATVVATFADRIARRLLPLTVLLRMTMLFPDRAPSRMRMARLAGNVTELRRRIAEAEKGDDGGLAEMAELILSLATALSNHDRKTRGHSERTRAYTELLAEELRLAEDDRDKLRWAALLHDVGKLEVPAEVLNKDSALTDEEWNLVRQHPVHGMRLVAPLVAWLGDWAKTIEHHHEKWDGSGYPYGLAGTEIAYGARIVAVADAYDVMTSGRSYQQPRTPATARREVTSMAGIQFDPSVARALMTMSLGKLRWATGPVAALAELPFFRGLPQISRDIATIVTSSALITTSLAVGTVTAPPLPDEVVEVVIVAADTSPSSSATTTTGTATPGTDGAPTAAATTTQPSTTTTTTATTTTSTTSTVSPTTVSPPPSILPLGPPRAGDDTAQTVEDVPLWIDVLANDADPDDDLAPSTLTVVIAPTKGTAVATSGGISYTPSTDANGGDRFVYRVCDTTGACASASVTVAITPVNDPPITPPLSLATSQGALVSSPLPYTDADGDSLRCRLMSPPAAGAATVPSDCSSVVYQPPSGYTGAVELAIEVSDGSIAQTATVTVEVTGP